MTQLGGGRWRRGRYSKVLGKVAKNSTELIVSVTNKNKNCRPTTHNQLTPYKNYEVQHLKKPNFYWCLFHLENCLAQKLLLIILPQSHPLHQQRQNTMNPYRGFNGMQLPCYPSGPADMSGWEACFPPQPIHNVRLCSLTGGVSNWVPSTKGAQTNQPR